MAGGRSRKKAKGKAGNTQNKANTKAGNAEDKAIDTGELETKSLQYGNNLKESPGPISCQEEVSPTCTSPATIIKQSSPQTSSDNIDESLSQKIVPVFGKKRKLSLVDASSEKKTKVAELDNMEEKPENNRNSTVCDVLSEHSENITNSEQVLNLDDKKILSEHSENITKEEQVNILNLDENKDDSCVTSTVSEICKNVNNVDLEQPESSRSAVYSPGSCSITNANLRSSNIPRTDCSVPEQCIAEDVGSEDEANLITDVGGPQDVAESFSEQDEKAAEPKWSPCGSDTMLGGVKEKVMEHTAQIQEKTNEDVAQVKADEITINLDKVTEKALGSGEKEDLKSSYGVKLCFEQGNDSSKQVPEEDQHNEKIDEAMERKDMETDEQNQKEQETAETKEKEINSNATIIQEQKSDCMTEIVEKELNITETAKGQTEQVKGTKYDMELMEEAVKPVQELTIPSENDAADIVHECVLELQAVTELSDWTDSQLGQLEEDFIDDVAADAKQQITEKTHKPTTTSSKTDIISGMKKPAEDGTSLLKSVTADVESLNNMLVHFRKQVHQFTENVSPGAPWKQ